ncbi:hypothetical protein Taro_034039 [Colocasia esculenta]|uniref:Uncharacterized protein n=1 Tax=Colocasia esculenta TaxID=4460 RepID=A0A843VZL8_COLES|nr:hypothetical protein [Colocasia esculenta]
MPYRDMSFRHVLGGAGLKPKAAPPVSLSPSQLSFSPLLSLSSFPCGFLVLETFMLRWCRPARAGDVFVSFGARRRRPFLREGLNGFVLCVECENSMLEVECDFSAAAGCAPGRGDGAVGEVSIASSGCPYFSVRHPQGTLVFGVCPSTMRIVEVYVVFLDTLTRVVLELYVQLRERR